MNNIKKILSAVLLICVLAAYAVIPSAAEETSDGKEEVIYIMTDASGKVESVTAVNIFSAGEVEDYGEYSAVKLLNLTGDINYADGKVSFTAADRSYYQGDMISKIIPWNISLRYELDGQEYSAADVAGKSGKLKISFSITKNADCAGNFFKAYGLQATVKLDTEKCRNIVAEGATEANVGTLRQLSYTILPGSGLNAVIEADVTDFEMEAVAINGVRLNLSIDIDTTAFGEKITEITDAVKQMKDGVSKLSDGGSKLADGTKELKKGCETFTDGIAQLSSGANAISKGSDELASGAATAADGASQLAQGAGELDSGTGEIAKGAADLKTGAEKLSDGAEELKKGANDAASGASGLSDGATALAEGTETLDSKVKELDAGMTKLSDGGKELTDGLDEITGNNKKLNSGMQQAFSALCTAAQTQINSKLSNYGLSEITLTASNYTTVINNLVNVFSKKFGSTAQGQEAVNQLTDLLDQLNDFKTLVTGVADYTSAVSTAASGAHELADGIDTAKAGTAALSDATGLLADKTGELASGAGELAAGNEKLALGAGELALGAAQLSDGAAGMKTGADKLAAGTAVVADKTAELAEGLEKISSGASELKAGIDTLITRIPEFETGVAKLSSGAVALDDGVGELNTGLKTLYDGVCEFDTRTANIKQQVSDMISEMMANLTAENEATVSFVSDKNTDVKAVQFVIKTAAVSKPASSGPDDTPAVTLTFWQKLLRLFGLY